MSILSERVRPTISRDRIIKAISNRIQNNAVDWFDSLIKMQNTGIDALWENPTITPQEIVDELGENAIKVFQYHAALTDLIIGIAQIDGVDVSNKLKYPTNAFSIDNETGRIIIDTSTPYTP